MTGTELIAAERQRQIESEGWTHEHDDEHQMGEIAIAAACYALPEIERVESLGCHEPEYGGDGSPLIWPWGGYWKPTPNDRVRELVKAGALIAAEIDRLRRAEQSQGKP